MMQGQERRSKPHGFLVESDLVATMTSADSTLPCASPRRVPLLRNEHARHSYPTRQAKSGLFRRSSHILSLLSNTRHVRGHVFGWLPPPSAPTAGP